MKALSIHIRGHRRSDVTEEETNKIIVLYMKEK